jgi:biopolymer transport protein ExbD
METKSKLTYFSQLNVTPLTDVFLVLLVVMIIISPIVQRANVLKVDPPSTGGCYMQHQPNPQVEIEAKSDGQITLNGRSIQPPTSLAIEAELRKLVHNIQGNVEVRLQAEADTSQKDLVAVIDAANGVGIKTLRILPLRDQ